MKLENKVAVMREAAGGNGDVFFSKSILLEVEEIYLHVLHILKGGWQ